MDTKLIVLSPIILGKGKSLFDGVQRNLTLKLTHTRTFRNGNVVLTYAPMT